MSWKTKVASTLRSRLLWAILGMLAGAEATNLGLGHYADTVRTAVQTAGPELGGHVADELERSDKPTQPPPPAP